MKIRLIYMLFFFAVTGHVIGQSLDEYLILAAENNPGLKAKYFQYQAALERIPQAGTLPDPQLSFGLFIMPMERYTGNQVAGISLRQMFPWFGTLSAAKDEMTFMAKAKFEAFNDAKSMLFYEVRVNWYALYLLENEIAIIKENIELLKTMEQIAITRFKSGGENTGNSGSGMDMKGQLSMENMGKSTGMIDVLRLKMEINALQNKWMLLKDSKIPLVSRFNQLLNRSVIEPVILPDTISAAQMPLELADMPDSIRNNNPMLQMLEQEESAFISQEKKNRKTGLPMIGLGLQYDIFKPRAEGESMMNGQNMLMPMVAVSIPLWRKKYTASVRESAFMRQSVIKQKQDLTNRLMVNYEEALKDFKDADRRIRLYQNQTLLANQALNILIAQYTSEGVNFEEVLRMQQQLLDYRLKNLDALVDGNIAAAMMRRLMGR